MGDDEKKCTNDDDGQSMPTRFLPPIDEETGCLNRKKVQNPEDEYWGLFVYEIEEDSLWKQQQASDDKEELDEKSHYVDLVNKEGYIFLFPRYDTSLVMISFSKTILLETAQKRSLTDEQNNHYFIARLPVWKPPHLPISVCDSLRCWVRRSYSSSYSKDEMCLVYFPSHHDFQYDMVDSEYLTKHFITLDKEATDWMYRHPSIE